MIGGTLANPTLHGLFGVFNFIVFMFIDLFFGHV
jgi:hypothetical protein